MPAISMQDLENAKTDVDHIAAVATSLDPTATDRLGHVKQTLAGAIGSIAAITDRGAWATGTAYLVKDLVTAAGIVYICVLGHTAGATFAGDSAKWRVYSGLSATSGAGSIGHSEGEHYPVGTVGAFMNETVMQTVNRDGRASIALSEDLTVPRSLVFLGDSITYGFGVDSDETYPYLVQRALGGGKLEQQGDCQYSIANLGRLTKSGTITYGTAGPLKNSYILAAGASLSFTADNIDQLDAYVVVRPGSGSLVFKKNGSAYRTVALDGPLNESGFTGLVSTPFLRSGASVTWAMEASGGNVEITGVFASHRISPDATYTTAIAQSGYATADFIGAPQLYAVLQQAKPLGGAGHPLCVIALGTNDIYSPAAAVPVATYKANLKTIARHLSDNGAWPVLTVPLKSSPSSTYQPVLDKYENYRAAVYEAAQELGNLRVVDLSKLGIWYFGYQADGVHPNASGMQCIAQYYIDQLNLRSREFSGVSESKFKPLALTSPLTEVGGTYATPSYRLGFDGSVQCKGTVAVNGASFPITVATLPQEACPPFDVAFPLAGMTSSGGIITTGLAVVRQCGAIEVLSVSGTSAYLWLDAVRFSRY